MILEANAVCKSIKGKLVLRNIGLKLESGNVYGFIGGNGSGKTMLFRALSGLIRLDSGSVSLDGQVLHRDIDVLPGLGIVIENITLFPELSAMDNLMFLAGIRKQIGEAEAAESLRRVGLEPEDRRPCRKYSLGMKQKLAIAQAIMEKPNILMLDEPTNALDEESVERVRTIILEEKARGAMILLSSHIREDMNALANIRFHMKNGEITEVEEC